MATHRQPDPAFRLTCIVPNRAEADDWVGGTSEGLRRLIAAGADDSLLDSFMRAKARGDLETAESILSMSRPLLAETPPIGTEEALQRVRVAALRPYVNSMDSAELQQFVLGMLELSEAVVNGLEGKAEWSVRGVVDVVAEVVRDASIKRLQRRPEWPASTSNVTSRPAQSSREDQFRRGLLDQAHFAALLGWTAGRIDRALASNSIFAVSIEGTRFYPRFLADQSYSRRHLSAVCRLLGELPGPSKLQFFTTPKASLGGESPLDALLKRRFAAVCAAAQGFAAR
jgi:hypothetical protein